MSPGRGSDTGLGLERYGSDEVYFTRDGEPLLSFGGLSDFVFYADRETYDYVRWADWATEHGMNHVRAYLPTSWRYIERFTEENGGDVDGVVFPYEETRPGTRSFDLGRLNDDYWERFRRKCEYFEQNGIVVHLLVINGWHISNHIASPDAVNWGGHFFNPENNVNAYTDHLADDRYEFYCSVGDAESELVEAQQRFLRRAVDETATLGNVYYDLVHELHPDIWVDKRENAWSSTQAWLETMARTVRERWNEHTPEKPCLVGQDTSKMTDDQVDWVLGRPYFDLAIYGRVHSVERAREWRQKHGKPYIPQESIDDSGEKYSYREPNQRVHLRKYVWKFVMAKCQQIDLYVKERTEGMAPTVGVTQPPGPPHDYDPDGWNEFERDATVVREFWNSLVDYPNLRFDGAVRDGPGSHQYVLSSGEEMVTYLSSDTSVEGNTYPAETVAVSGLATSSGRYRVEIIDPAVGVIDTLEDRVSGGRLSVDLPAFTDDIVVHVSPT